MMDIPVTQEVLDMNPDLAAEEAEEVTAQVPGKGWSRPTQG